MRRAKSQVETGSARKLRTQDEVDDWNDLAASCEDTVIALDKIVTKYPVGSRRSNWYRLLLGSKNLADLHRQLNQCTTDIAAFFSISTAEAVGRMEPTLQDIEHLVGNLPDMRATIQTLAEHARRDGSVMTVRNGDDSHVWRRFRRSLINKGLTSAAIEQHEADISEYLQSLVEEGVLGTTAAGGEAEAHTSEAHVQSRVERPQSKTSTSAGISADIGHRQGSNPTEQESQPRNAHAGAAFQPTVEIASSGEDSRDDETNASTRMDFPYARTESSSPSADGGLRNKGQGKSRAQASNLRDEKSSKSRGVGHSETLPIRPDKPQNPRADVKSEETVEPSHSSLSDKHVDNIAMNDSSYSTDSDYDDFGVEGVFADHWNYSYHPDGTKAFPCHPVFSQDKQGTAKSEMVHDEVIFDKDCQAFIRDQRGNAFNAGLMECRKEAIDMYCDADKLVVPLDPELWDERKTTLVETEIVPIPRHWMSASEDVTSRAAQDQIGGLWVFFSRVYNLERLFLTEFQKR